MSQKQHLNLNVSRECTEILRKHNIKNISAWFEKKVREHYYDPQYEIKDNIQQLNIAIEALRGLGMKIDLNMKNLNTTQKKLNTSSTQPD